MEAVLSDLFGSLGGLLTIFIIAFCALAMPVGIYLAMKNAVKFSEEQDRLHAQHKQDHVPH